jgi:thiol-disulfide isomerase/thioredoxin
MVPVAASPVAWVDGMSGSVATGPERGLLMLKRLALLTVLVANIAFPAALAGQAPPLAGSVADFSRIDPPLPAPDDSFKDGRGRTLRLADFRGRVVLLNIWATWCGPCKAEMASLDRLQSDLGGADFIVLPVSIDRGGGPSVALFYGERELTHLGVYLDARSALADRMGIDGVPTSFVIDRQGRLVGKLVGATDWDTPEALALLRRYIGERPAAPPQAQVVPTAYGRSTQRVGTGFSPL